MNRAAISKRNTWWIEKHRFYELRHFCLQYDIWKKARAAVDGLARRPGDITKVQSFGISNPVERAVETIANYDRLINMVDKAAAATDAVIGGYILEAVTKGYSYETLRARTNVPCCKRTYYELYRKFFWILNKLRD